LDKLIITVTCDSTMSYPSNPSNPTPKGWDAVADEYVRSVGAGAAICHLHGPYTVDSQIQADGTKLSDLQIPGWGRLRDSILGRCDTVIQYGIANGRFPQRKDLMRTHKPDMISVCFNAHDECFNYEPGKEPVELYGLHNRVELAEYVKVTKELGVKMEIEAFHYGGVWNALRMIETENMDPSVWVTFFLGWRGGCWTPPTVKALVYMQDHLPAGFTYNTSVMDPENAWTILTAAVMMGGHVRVGMEDNPFLTPGEYARSNAELVEKIVRIAREVGRDIATPDEARAVLKIAKGKSRMKN
jgi:3-keto-5-aminohexanoate cleavage enzyme